MSPVKEPGYFSGAMDEASYLDLFRGAEGYPVVGESSTSYLTDPEAPGRIHEVVPAARILVSLRDPVERAYSGYLSRVRDGRETRSFGEFTRDHVETWRETGSDGFIENSMYHDHLARYVDTFGEDRIHVVLFEDLKRDAVDLLRGIAEFLDIDPDPMEDVDTSSAHNPFGVPRNPLAQFLRTDPRVRALARRLIPRSWRIWLGEHLLLERVEKPPMDPEAGERLRTIYADQVVRLEDLLGRDLPELRRSP